MDAIDRGADELDYVADYTAFKNGNLEKFSEDIFYTKYSHEGAETFHELACTLVEDVCQDKMTKDEKEKIKHPVG